MADESEIVTSPITDIIKNSIMEYATNRKREIPREVKQIIKSDNSQWKYVGFDNISCEYLFESKDGKELIKYNYKTKELLSYNSEEMFHRFYNPVNKSWEIYIPQKGMHYNIKTNRWEYYNVATDEWLGISPKAYIKNEENDENSNYTVSYDKEKNIYKYNSKEVSAVYIVADKVWAIHNKVANRTAYISATNGKEMTLDEESGKFYIKEISKKSTNQEPKVNDNKVEVEENDSKIETKTQDSEEDIEKKENETENNENLGNTAEIVLVPAKTTFFSRVKNWFKEKIFKSKSSNKTNEMKKETTNKLVEEKINKELDDILDKIDNEVTPDGKVIYRSETTKQKMREKEYKKIKRRLKLAEFKKGLKFTDTKKSISLIVASGLLAIGATVNLVYKGIEGDSNRVSTSVSENTTDNNNQGQVENGTIKEEKQSSLDTEEQGKIGEQITTEKDPDENDIKEDKFNINMVSAGTVYTSNSKGDGNKGIFKVDTPVGIYNRAIIKVNDDGSKEIVLSTNGMTWEEYSKSSGKSMEEIDKIKNTEGNIEMVAVSVPDTDSLQGVYGWIKSEDLKNYEVSIGDNTQILQNLIEHEGERE